MCEHPLYPYITNDNRETKQHYMYSSFNGLPFLESYGKIRDATLERLKRKFSASRSDELEDELVMQYLIETGYISAINDAEKLDKWIHSFEIRKRVYGAYDNEYRPLNVNDYLTPGPYVALASVISLRLASGSGGLKYLNTLLKLIDSILSFEEELSEKEIGLVHFVLSEERKQVRQLQTAKGLDL
jgi:hypothetical protein